MIATILIVSLAFYWLLLETDWLRIRLLYGAIAQIIEYRKSWEELKPHDIKKNHPFWMRFPEHMEPLCGWHWLEETMHIIPDYKIELIGTGYKTTIRSQSTEALRDAFRVNRNPHIKIKMA